MFPGGKDGRYVRLTTLPPSCADYLKIWELQHLDASGPVKVCNRTALPFFSQAHRFIPSLRKNDSTIQVLAHMQRATKRHSNVGLSKQLSAGRS
jgi:hypothetical protein